MIEEEAKGKELDNEIFKVVVKKLEDKDVWFEDSTNSIHHKTENICLNYDMDAFQIRHNLTEPEKIRAPRKYNKKIQKLVRNILGFNTNQKKLFCLDVVNGKYPGYIDESVIPGQYGEEFKEWLDNEVREENYVVRNTGYHQVIYFKREADHAFVILKWL